MGTVNAYAALKAGGSLVPYTFEARELRNNDVEIEILYCGVCHSDLHQVRNDWHESIYPIVPGHEIVGKVVGLGKDVKKYNIGDLVAVGCMVDSCQECDQCKYDQEQYCKNGFTPTYNGIDRVDKKVTTGGYANKIIARQEFVLSVPSNLDISRVAPLLCAGITTYSPLRHWDVRIGSKVGVIGLGGLGHMAVKLASAIGAQVIVIGRSQDKVDEAKKLGADEYLLSTDLELMDKNKNKFDLIIDTIPVEHDISIYLPLLNVNGSLVMVGQIGPIEKYTSIPLIFGRRNIAGSLIGGIAETQELLDFCAKKNVLPDCEIIPINNINQAFIRMENSDVHYRFVIDMTTLQ